ncbi:MAG: hypothetical protein V1827_00725 [Candidatus Micrarchaeota archaeon]
MAVKEKNKGNGFTLKALLGAVLCVLSCVALLVAANAAMPFRNLGPAPEGLPPPDLEPNPMQQAFLVHAALSFLMLLLSFYLFYIYLKDYLTLKSSFTLGLLIAIFSFMLFAVAANPFLHVLFGAYGRGGLFQLIPYIFSTISLAVLVYVSSR